MIDPHSDEAIREVAEFIMRYFNSGENDPYVAGVAFSFASAAQTIASAPCYDHEQRMHALRCLRQSMDAAGQMQR